MPDDLYAILAASIVFAADIALIMSFDWLTNE